MKHLLAALLCLLLCGCAVQTTPETQPPPETQPETVSMYDPTHPVELAHPGEVRAYPLTIQNVRSILPFGRNVLVLSGDGNTTLTLLTGELLVAETGMELGFTLQGDDPSLQLQEDFLSFYDPQAKETVVLDRRLQEIRRIAAPSGLSGAPLLSDDGTTLYYCTSWAVMAWDLESGIRRTLREMTDDSQKLSGLHCGGTILQCCGSYGEILLISTENGAEIKKPPRETSLVTRDSRYFALIPAGMMQLPVFGDGPEEPRLLLPEGFYTDLYYLPEDHSVITVTDTDIGVFLDYYELSTGLLRASLTLDPGQLPKTIINCKGHGLYILTQDSSSDVLYRWDVLQQTPDTENTTDHTYAYAPADAPDKIALAGCREYADAIGEKYGITLRIWKDAAALQPWDYSFEAEHLTPILRRELKLLDQNLARYPDAVLEKTAEHFSGLTISLVREITGTPESGSLSKATGIQFFQDGEACVAIAVGKYARQALYHEFYHVMETHILAKSTALDTWESLNPAGFTYGTEEEVYLRGQTRAFVDSYSMTYPKEDRARIFEYAMLPGQEALFRSEYMQRKLTAVCTAIREAYQLKKHPEVLPWEQYLAVPLTPEE